MIKEMQTEEELAEVYPVIRQLRSHLSEKEYLELVCEAQVKEMYQLAALYHEDQIVAVVGFKPMITLYYGRFVWVCDLVTDEAERSKGHGEKLLDYVHHWAKDHGYGSVALSSGLSREDAHRFYEEKMNYQKVSYVYKTDL